MMRDVTACAPLLLPMPLLREDDTIDADAYVAILLPLLMLTLFHCCYAAYAAFITPYINI